MTLNFSLSAASDVPIYKQITNHIQRLILLDQIKVGDQLPGVRVLAETLVVNPNTVARAYQELIREGTLESRSGIGVFVAEKRHQSFSSEERNRRLRQSVEQLSHEALLLGLTLTEMQDAVKKYWKNPDSGKSKK